MKRTKLSFFAFLILFTCLFFSFNPFIKDKPYIFPEINYFPVMPVSASNSVTINGVELGRYLFYDPILSFDSSISCASCHKQEFAFSDSPNQFSKGIYQQLQNRNTMPLFNLAWYPNLFWDGRAETIEQQVFHPVRDKKEMSINWKEAEKKIKRNKFYKKLFNKTFGKIEIDSNLISKAIAQFERTLISYNAKYDKVLRHEAKFTMEELEGLELLNDMTKGNCLHCHTTDANGLGTTGEFSNNGLDEVSNSLDFKDIGRAKTTKKDVDIGKFKIPSLRNLLFTAPYMHDGRFKTLEEIVNFYSEGLKISPTIDSKMEFAHNRGSKFTNLEKKKIIAFLKTLSDSSFIKDKRFSNPFSK
ncbi:MAG: cytochrome c peroxidase [Bacteroidia bacterium]